MSTADQIVNTLLVIFCILGYCRILYTFVSSDGEDKIAAGIMIVVPTAMIASDAIAAAVFGKETLLEFWINAFFSIAIGLLLKKMYSYMDEFKHPLKVFVRCIIVVAAIYAVIQIIEFIF